jgi:Crp-like helix-turn-helix domain
VHDELSSGLRAFLDGLPSPDRDRAQTVLLACATIEIDAGVPRVTPAFPPGVLLLVEDGFVVLRATVPRALRSVVTCEAGAGRLLLPPSPDEVLVGLGSSRLTVIDADARGELLRIQALAERVVEQLALALSQKQEATANFAPTRHIERVRRKLLQLGRSYGHVVPDGIRIDFPVSHALLAEMIGSSRETVTRAVDELQRAGFVARRGSTYRLLVSPESVFEPLQP